ncbi:MAG: hypothetical protein ACIAXF_04380 [Phycisphaerales bacterium JB063]
MLRAKRRPARRATGLTLIELMLALAGISLIGSAIASMLVAVSYGTQADKDLRGLITKQMALRSRLSAALRESTMVLEHGAGYVYLWEHDADGSGTPNLSEITLVEFDADTQTLEVYRAPAAPSSDLEYDLSASFTTQTASVRATADFPATRWASGVEAFETTLDHDEAQSARLVGYRFTLLAGEESDEVVGAAALRNGGGE